LGLLAVQAWVLRRFCPGCVVVDLLAITAFIGVIIADRAIRTSKEVEVPLRPLVVSTYLVIACVAPFLWPHFRPAASVPPPLLRFQKPDRTTLLEFVDLQCPHCVALYPALEQLRREYGDTISIQRIHVPPENHAVAFKAARLLTCLRAPKDVEILERVFFETPKLTELTVRTIAVSAGFTTSSMEACFTDEDSARRVREHRELFRQLGHLGLPTVFVGGERITGAKPLIAYQAAIFKARRSSARSKSEVFAFWGIVLMLMVTVYAIGQRDLDRGV
jgi:thiol-disulfide isomerase/thioredoxin